MGGYETALRTENGSERQCLRLSHIRCLECAGLCGKLNWSVPHQLPDGQAVELENMIWYCADLADTNELLPLITLPVQKALPLH